MSASDKKKLRKELNAAAMTERQQTEQKQQKKLKIITVTFVVVMVLVVALVLGSVLTPPITRAIIKNTVAAKVNGHEISATELNYFYCDAISNLYSQFDDYGDYQDLYVQLYTGLTPTKALDEQTYSEEVGTWADYFIDTAVTNAQWVYAMCDAAEAAGHELTEDEQKSIDSAVSYMSLYAYYYGFTDADAYIRAVYGTSASMEGYTEYYTKCQLASSFVDAYIDGLEYTDADYRSHEADKMAEYNSYSWASYYVNSTNYLKFLKLGTTTTGDDGKESTTYSDEDKKAALEAAKSDADSLLAGEITSIEDLNTAINALAINKDSTTELSASEYTNYLYASAESYTPNDEALEWLTSTDRVEGDMTVIAYTTTDSDGNETTNGYYVLYYVSSTDNSEFQIGTVRHLLVAFEEDDDGNVTDEAKEEARLTAQTLLDEYKAGKQTEEAFTALIKEHSDDTEDGLYSDINPGSSYVESFKNWATAKHEVGDVEIIESEYGFHIMYYVSCGELNYRDALIDAELKSDAYTDWEENTILKDATSEELNLKYIDRDYIISSGS